MDGRRRYCCFSMVILPYKLRYARQTFQLKLDTTLRVCYIMCLCQFQRISNIFAWFLLACVTSSRRKMGCLISLAQSAAILKRICLRLVGMPLIKAMICSIVAIIAEWVQTLVISSNTLTNQYIKSMCLNDTRTVQPITPIQRTQFYKSPYQDSEKSKHKKCSNMQNGSTGCHVDIFV